MGQSLTKLFVHIIFHIKRNSSLIKESDKKDLYAYIGAIIKDNDSIPILINGVEDHIHILCVQTKNITIAKLVEEVKRHSSRWIKTKDFHYKGFAWQGGYGVFTVSASLVEKTKTYINMQKEHHKKMSFREEYVLFLKEYGVDYNENYLWTD